MADCDKNVKEVVKIGFFGFCRTTKIVGDHEWTKWGESKFSAVEYKDIGGKKKEPFGHNYQYRNCVHCNMIESRICR